MKINKTMIKMRHGQAHESITTIEKRHGQVQESRDEIQHIFLLVHVDKIQVMQTLCWLLIMFMIITL